MMSFAHKRLTRELAKIHQGLPPGITFVNADNLSHWLMDIQVLDTNPIYHGKIFRLNFRFSPNYPIEAPEVTFLLVETPSREIPLHPHVYSNGVICLDLLSSGNGWSPVQSVESICMSIQSMLTGNTKAERPDGDDNFSLGQGRSIRDINFIYDDPTV